MKTQPIKFTIVDNILIGTYSTGLVIDLIVAKEIIKIRKQFIGDNSYPSLLDAIGLKSIDREAREYLSSDESYEGVVAGALLSGSIFTSYLGNFFLRVTTNKPKVPIRMFTNKQKAMNWLKQFNR